MEHKGFEPMTLGLQNQDSNHTELMPRKILKEAMTTSVIVFKNQAIPLHNHSGIPNYSGVVLFQATQLQ